MTSRLALALGLASSSLLAAAQGAAAAGTDVPTEGQGVVVELNGGLPRLATDDLRLVGDARLGYASDALGLIARGGLRYYDTAARDLATDTLHWRAGLDGWWRAGEPGARARFELRLEGSVESYDSTVHPKTPAGGYFHDEDSTMSRGTLLAGVALEPSPALYLRVLAGAGVQYESFGYLSLDPADANLFSDTTSFSPRYAANAVVRWRLWPGIAALRARVEGEHFDVTRANVFLGQGAATPSAGVVLTSFRQLDVAARAFLDLDVLGFGGFVPAAWGGADIVSIAGKEGSTSTVVAAFGVGLVRPVL